MNSVLLRGRILYMYRHNISYLRPVVLYGHYLFVMGRPVLSYTVPGHTVTVAYITLALLWEFNTQVSPQQVVSSQFLSLRTSNAKSNLPWQIRFEACNNISTFLLLASSRTLHIPQVWSQISRNWNVTPKIIKNKCLLVNVSNSRR